LLPICIYCIQQGEVCQEIKRAIFCAILQQLDGIFPNLSGKIRDFLGNSGGFLENVHMFSAESTKMRF